jgi:hypothetical protein
VTVEHDAAVKALVSGDADCHFLATEEFLCSGNAFLLEDGDGARNGIWCHAIVRECLNHRAVIRIRRRSRRSKRRR